MKKFTIILLGINSVLITLGVLALVSNNIEAKHSNIVTSDIVYEGHSYIIFEDAKTFEIIHNPDCECYKIDCHEEDI